MVISIKIFSKKFYIFFIYIQSLASVLTYCGFFLQNIQDLMSNAYPEMINLERDQMYLKTCTFFLFEPSQEVPSVYN